MTVIDLPFHYAAIAECSPKGMSLKRLRQMAKEKSDFYSRMFGHDDDYESDDTERVPYDDKIMASWFGV